MMGGYGWGGMAWMPFIGLFWLLILVVLIAAVTNAFRGLGSPHDAPERGDRRLTGPEILDERYARGEINREEYLQKKQDIRG